MRVLNEEAFLQATNQFKTIPISQSLYVDTLTPIQIFEGVKEEAIYLLESRDEASPWSRYSFIGINPLYVLKEVDHGIQVMKGKEQLFSKKTFKEAFNHLKEVMKVLPFKEDDIPFNGGAVGYMSYDAISMIEKVAVHENDDLNMSKLHFMICETMFVFDHQKRELTTIHFIEVDEQSTLEYKKNQYENGHKKINQYIDNIMKTNVTTGFQMTNMNPSSINLEKFTSNYEKEDFLRDVNKIKEYIKAGDVFQAVLSQRFETNVTVSGFQLYRVLRLINPSPYLYYIRLPDAEIIGSSPERLIQIQDKKLEIHPIAGTRRRGMNKEEDQKLAEELLADEKERAEHYMLVDLARNDIGRVAEYGSVVTPVVMEIGKFSHVMHLISVVNGVLRENVDPIDALTASFPAGTVSGAPKVRAMQILQELEPNARGLYAGTVAYIDFNGNIDSCIAIRTILLKNQKAFIQAGAGIVADSVPINEWKETRNKASALLHAVEMAEKIFDKNSSLIMR